MRIAPYEPWTSLQRFRDDVDRLFNERLALSRGDEDASEVATSRWSPAVDIKEEQDRYLITADIPGVEPKDIEVTMENGMLTIKGERNAERRDEGSGYRRVERMSGTFYRRFGLPDTADPEQIKASGRNGVLEIEIPKQEKVKPRRIEVQH